MPRPTAPDIADHRVVFIRHGESVHNAAYLMGQEPADGLIDAPLSTRGRRQAEELREVLRMTNAELVTTSPLTRAIETALTYPCYGWMNTAPT